MKVSYLWLQKYFEKPLPTVGELSDAITFRAFEIDGIEQLGEDTVLDVKVLPDRTHDCLSHRGIAKEIAAILNVPMQSDPFAKTPDLSKKTAAIEVTISEQEQCSRYIAGYIKGVKVAPSPQWLQDRLAALGQRSINNVVDATNFVMFNLGQPLHAFDASKLKTEDGKIKIEVRAATEGEKMTALDLKEYTLKSSMMVIADKNANVPVGIAGIKGGTPASITESTVDIILESANFDGVSIRKTSRALNLRTDASVRFENIISAEMAAYGIESAVELILKLAGGELVGFVDEYPNVQPKEEVVMEISDVNRLFGIKLSSDEVEGIIKRFNWMYRKEGESFVVSVPFERLDMTIPEDVAADIGRIYGYDKIPSVVPEALGTTPVLNKRFYYIDRIRQWLVEHGFSEIYTSVFSIAGKRQVLNKVDSDRPFLRSDIWPNLQEALERNYGNRDLLGIPDVRLFEIGTVWTDDGEKTMLAVGTLGPKTTPPGSSFVAGLIKEFDLKVPQDIPMTPVVQLDLDSLIVHAPDPLSYQELPTLGDVKYKPFSRYPFIVRDVAFWAPLESKLPTGQVNDGSDIEAFKKLIKEATGDLVVRIDLFDRFEKPASQGGEGKISYGFRLIFQAADRTLTDETANADMLRLYDVLKGKGYEIR